MITLSLRINRTIKLYPDLLLPYLVLVSCLFIPAEITITHVKMDETSTELSPFIFKTLLYGYESKILLFTIGLTVLNQLTTFLNRSFSSFLLVFTSIIFLVFTSFQLLLNTKYLDLGCYFGLISSGFILFFNLRKRFW